MSHSSQISFLPLEPGRLRCLVAVGAALHNVEHPLPELLPYSCANDGRIQGRLRVFYRVVEEGPNCFLFMAHETEDYGGDSEHVRDVRNLCAFAPLACVDFSGKADRVLKAW